MQTVSVTPSSARPVAARVPRDTSATRIAVSVYGVLVGIGGVEHGIGEMLQGSVRPDGMVIESWPHAPAVRVLSGEPAMTIVPDMMVSGILAIAVGLAIVVWSAAFVARPHGGAVLVALSGVLLLVGGGFGPPLMGLIVGLTATRIGAGTRRAPGPVMRTLGRFWPWLLGAAVASYLSLMPGVVVLRVDDAGVVAALTVLVFATLGAALIAARAHDRTRACQTVSRAQEETS